MPTIAPTTPLPTTMTSVEPTPDPLTSPTTEIPTSNQIAIITTSTTLSAENTTLQTTTTSTSVATLFFTTSEILISVESTRFDYDAIRIPILCALLVGACALCSVIIIVLRKRCTAPKPEKYETAALAAKPARTQSEIEAIVFRGHRYNNTASSADIYHGKGSYDSLEQKEEKEESDMDIEIGSDPTDKMLSIIGEIYDQYDAVHVTRRGPSISNIDLDVSSGRGSGSDDDYAIVEKPNLHNFSTKSLRRQYNTTTTSILMDRDEEKLHVPISSEVLRMGSLCCKNVKKCRHYAIFVCVHFEHNNYTLFEFFKQFYTQNEELNHCDEEWIEYNVYNNEFPTHNELLSISGIILTGATTDAYDDKLEWVLKLRKLTYKIVNESVFKHIKLIGHCFGHQIIAHSLKCGKVSINTLKKDIDDNFEIGARRIALNDNFYKIFPYFKDQYANRLSLTVLKFHRDAVVSLPRNATSLASSKWTEFELFTINDRVLSFQGHPEFPTSAIKVVMEVFLDSNRFGQQTYDGAMKSMQQKHDHHIWSKLFSEWLRR